MRLVRLEVFLRDAPHIDHGDTLDGGVGAKIRALLQAQPFLEDFKLSERLDAAKSTASLQACGLQASDVPSLKSLQAKPGVALAFLPVAPRLESLKLMTTMWSELLLSSIATKASAIKLSIRRFTISVWDHNRWFWNNLDHVFALFPNVEYLSVSVNVFPWSRNLEARKVSFGVIANHVHHFPYLRDIEVRYSHPGVKLPDILKVETQTALAVKRACPLLEIIVDPERRLWMFRPHRESPSGFVPVIVGPLMVAEHPWDMKDLPTRESNS
ncbi:hypothetical protein FS837_004052 [Tulasnella sp. UAMH 9824]|nr:hypothetical protein FS837_004052 [Tulasnella sp. UAMH 9824]